MAEAVRLEITVDDKGSPVIKTVTDNLDKLAQQSAKTATEHTKLNRVADEASKIFGTLGGQLGGAASMLADAVGPAGLLTVGLGATVLAAKESVTAFKDLALQTRDLAFLSGGTAEQVSGLIDVLDDYGIEAETVNRAMNFLSKAVQDGSPALDRLGVSIRSSSGHLKSAHDLFYEVVDALSKMRSETDRNAVGQEIFGRQWINLIPAIQKGAAALREAAEASELAMSKDDIARAERYRQELAEIGDQLLLFKINISRGIIEPSNLAMKALNEVIARGREAMAIGALANKGGYGSGIGIPDFKAVSKAYSDVGAWRGGRPGADDRSATPPEGETPGEKKAREEREKAAKAEADAISKTVFESLTAQNKMIAEAQELGVKFYLEQAKEVDAIKKDSLEKQAKILQDAIDLGNKSGGEELKNARDRWEEERKAKEQAGQEAYEIAKKYADMEARTNAEAWSAVDKYNLEQYSKRRQEFDSLFEPVSRALSGSLQGILQGTQTVEDAMRRMGQNIAASLFETVVQKGLKQISDALFQFLDQLGGSGGGSSWISQIFSAIGTAVGSGAAAGTGGIFPGHFTPIRAFAGGGIADRPTIGLIGEGEYKEAIVPLPDGRSIPARVTGGGGAQIFIDARKAERGVSSEIMRAIRAGMNQAVTISMARVNDQRRRGGMRGLDR